MIITLGSSTFSRPADTTAYASADLIADCTTAGSVNPLAFKIIDPTCKLQRASILKTSTNTTNAQFRLHLYNSKPLVLNGDNASWNTTVSSYLGDVDIDNTLRTFASQSIGFGLFLTSDVPAYMSFSDRGTHTIYGLLEARAAYTPTSKEQFTVTLYGEI